MIIPHYIHIIPHICTLFDIFPHYSTYIHIIPHIFTLFHIYSHYSTYIHIIPHIFTLFHIYSHYSTYFHIIPHIFTLFHIFPHILYAKRNMFQTTNQILGESTPPSCHAQHTPGLRPRPANSHGAPWRGPSP